MPRTDSEQWVTELVERLGTNVSDCLVIAHVLHSSRERRIEKNGAGRLGSDRKGSPGVGLKPRAGLNAARRVGLGPKSLLGELGSDRWRCSEGWAQTASAAQGVGLRPQGVGNAARRVGLRPLALLRELGSDLRGVEMRLEGLGSDRNGSGEVLKNVFFGKLVMAALELQK